MDEYAYREGDRVGIEDILKIAETSFGHDGQHPDGANQSVEHPIVLLATSGTTASPKIVAVTAQAISSLAVGQTLLGIHASDKVLQSSSASFDASLYEIWAALLAGAELIVIDRATLLDPHALRRQLVEAEVSVAFFTTSLFYSIVRREPLLPMSMRLVIFGGEAIPRSLETYLRGCRDLNCTLVNVYGPTECGTFTTALDVATEIESKLRLSIGRGIPNRAVSIVDQRGNACGVDLPGQIHITGPGVCDYDESGDAPGDAVRSASTAVGRSPMIYATGDVARLRDDGAIEFLGRADRQVKLRGNRIDLSELERAIEGSRSVSRVLVRVVSGPEGDSLVADVQWTGAPDVAALRVDLKRLRPAHLLPGIAYRETIFGLTSNGKLATGAEPAVDATEGAADIERIIVDVWRAALEDSTIQASDNFFDVGGHSLLAITVAEILSAKLGFEVPIRSLFDAQTGRDLAVLLSGNAGRVARANPSDT